MNAEELRETTARPREPYAAASADRGPGAAGELFRALLGDNVEPRRDFIQRHALDVKNLDV